MDFKIHDDKMHVHVILSHAFRPDAESEVLEFYYDLMERASPYGLPIQELMEC